MTQTTFFGDMKLSGGRFTPIYNEMWIIPKAILATRLINDMSAPPASCYQRRWIVRIFDENHATVEISVSIIG